MPASPLSRLYPYFALGFGVLGLGFSAMFVRWANAPGAVTGFYRMIIASALMLPVMLLARLRNDSLQRHEEHKDSKKGFFVSLVSSWFNLYPAGFWFAVLAGAGFAFDLALWNTAVNITTAANATLLTHTAPVLVGLGALVFFKEKLTGRFWLGLLLALGASIGFAGYFLAAQAGRRTLDSLTFFWIYSFSCAVFLLVVGVALRQPFGGYGAQTWVWFLALAVVTQVGGYLSISYAIGHLPASVVSPTMLGQPVAHRAPRRPVSGRSVGLAATARRRGGGRRRVAGASGAANLTFPPKFAFIINPELQAILRGVVEIAADATIEGWSHALDLRDRETEGRTQRVTEE